MSKFDRELSRAKKKIDDAIEKSIRAVAIEMFGEIVRRTPVGNPSLWKSDAPSGYIGGRLRGNWQVQLNTPARGEVDGTDSSGSGTISRGASKANQFTLRDNSIWFSNNLPYAERVEDGWSQQRPEGMMKTTVKSFKRELEKIARINIV